MDSKVMTLPGKVAYLSERNMQMLAPGGSGGA